MYWYPRRLSYPLRAEPGTGRVRFSNQAGKLVHQPRITVVAFDESGVGGYMYPVPGVAARQLEARLDDATSCALVVGVRV